MYSFKSLIYNLLEEFTNKRNELFSVISFYSAYSVALAINDLLEGTDSSDIVDKRNSMLEKYFKDQSPTMKTKIMNQISKDRRMIDKILEKIKEYEEEKVYVDENVDLRFVEGCIGTVIEGF